MDIELANKTLNDLKLEYDSNENYISECTEPKQIIYNNYVDPITFYTEHKWLWIFDELVYDYAISIEMSIWMSDFLDNYRKYVFQFQSIRSSLIFDELKYMRDFNLTPNQTLDIFKEELNKYINK